VPLWPAGANGANGVQAPAELDAQMGLQSGSLVCITAGALPDQPAELLGSQRFRDLLANVAIAYDAVILDTAPLLSVADTLEIVPEVDGVLMCVRAARTTREEARSAKAALDQLPPRPTGLVITGVRPGDESDYGYYASAGR
jgi:non-specific protein-tyrosine kinase